MIGTFLLALATLTAVGAVVAGPMALLVHRDRDGWAMAWLVVASVVGLAWLVAYLDQSHSGVHRWRGGSGPDTACVYEDRTVIVGKVPARRTFTVCRDAPPP